MEFLKNQLDYGTSITLDIVMFVWKKCIFEGRVTDESRDRSDPRHLKNSGGINGIRTQLSFIHYSFHGNTWVQQIDLLPTVWLNSSVDRALHRRGHVVRTPPEFFWFHKRKIMFENNLEFDLFKFFSKKCLCQKKTKMNFRIAYF